MQTKYFRVLIVRGCCVVSPFFQAELWDIRTAHGFHLSAENQTQHAHVPSLSLNDNSSAKCSGISDLWPPARTSSLLTAEEKEEGVVCLYFGLFLLITRLDMTKEML